jgi:hypothetical protein
VDQANVDFGDTDLQLIEQRTIVFHMDLAVNILPPDDRAPFVFYERAVALTPRSQSWAVGDQRAPPGDYTYDSVWTVAQPGTRTPPACAWRATIPIHMHVTGPDGGGDAASEGP